MAAPGLAFGLDHVNFRGSYGTHTLVLRLVLLTAGALLTFRLAGLHDPASPRSDEEHRRRISMLLVLGLAGLAAAGQADVPLVLVLLAATVEEALFRRHLPTSVTPLLQQLGLGRLAPSVAILTSQLAFAAAHFTVSNHPAPLSSGVPFIRLVAAGCFLAMIYEISGFAAAVAVHAALNLSITTRHLGIFIAPSTPTQTWCLVAGLMGVVAVGEYQRRESLASASRKQSFAEHATARGSAPRSLTASPSSR